MKAETLNSAKFIFSFYVPVHVLLFCLNQDSRGLGLLQGDLGYTTATCSSREVSCQADLLFQLNKPEA